MVSTSCTDHRFHDGWGWNLHLHVHHTAEPTYQCLEIQATESGSSHPCDHVTGKGSFFSHPSSWSPRSSQTTTECRFVSKNLSYFQISLSASYVFSHPFSTCLSLYLKRGKHRQNHSNHRTGSESKGNQAQSQLRLTQALSRASPVLSKSGNDSFWDIPT